jgi:DNA helicase-2/ATP-dependent DNA helicase PcrA
MTRVGTALRRVRDSYQSGTIPQTRQGQLSAVFAALRRVAEDDSFSAVITALELILFIPQAVMYRRELFEEMIRGLRSAKANGSGSLPDALWLARNRTRFVGRRLGRCVVGTTLLVKGLEFDHAIVLDADDMEGKNLYVALTRGARSLTIFSRSQTIIPKCKKRR